ncbi:hypothetical protein [Polyangium sp. 15x6]|uniref:hypothetical protein n=1 Tax=Polyangium sp. 15x6 TaxID=3042687 RepID=UPI00249A28FC|nr:hypothetical protein [Polyangium sp. 15x6]MDI3287634.1 hypothetical protein [Polyangium sp. 15x6]
MSTTSMKPFASSKGKGPASPLLAAIFVALLCGASACASEEGTTPTCTQDLDGEGHIDNVENGCNPFATCVVNGQVSPPAECCKEDLQGNPLEGYALAACLYGYGAGPAPGSGGDGGGGGN